MFAKVKRELDTESAAPAGQEQQARKRQRALNFSIESIMQSAEAPQANEEVEEEEEKLEVTCEQHQDEFAYAQSVASSSGSCDSPGNSSRASTPISLGQHEKGASGSLNFNDGQQHQQQAKGKKGSSSSSSGSWRSGSAATAAAAAAASTNQLLRSSACSEQRLAPVECTLDNKDMWDKFHSLNTEMIITKTGRRMFPVMKVQFHNLDPSARYAVSMDIVPVDNKRYRYAYHKSCWQVAGKADPSAEPRLYPHPDSPFNGDLLSRQVISFEKVKLTNNEMDKSGHIILNSMHKYQPRVHLIELKVTPATLTTTTTTPQTSSKAFSTHTTTDHHNHHHNHHHNNHHHQQQPQLDIKGYRTFVFPETVFTAVTAYQNQLITKMKIDKNPFAKGFRDSSRLSDLDRNDPFDYMGSLGPGAGARFGPPPGAPGSMEAVAAAAAAAGAGAHMDAYHQLLAAANNPWYSAAAVAAAAGGAAAANNNNTNNNPFNPMGAAAACSTAQAAQLQTTQAMWLAAFSALLNGGAGGAPPTHGPAPGLPPHHQHHHHHHQQQHHLGSMGPSGSMVSPMSAGPSPHLLHRDQLDEGLAGVGGNGEIGGPDSSGGRSSSSSSANV